MAKNSVAMASLARIQSILCFVRMERSDSRQRAQSVDGACVFAVLVF